MLLEYYSENSSFYPRHICPLLKGWCAQSSVNTDSLRCHAWLRLLQSQSQCSSTRTRSTFTKSHQYRYDYRWSYIRWRSCHRSRYKSYVWTDSSRQELREIALHRSPNMVCRRWNGCRHRIHHCHHLIQSRTPCPINRPQTPSRYMHDYAEATPFPIPRPRWCILSRCWCRSDRGWPLHSTRPRKYRQAPLRHHGIWIFGSDGGI